MVQMLSWTCFEQKDNVGVVKILDDNFESSMGGSGRVESKGSQQDKL